MRFFRNFFCNPHTTGAGGTVISFRANLVLAPDFKTQYKPGGRMSNDLANGKWWQEAWYIAAGCQHMSSGCDNCWAEASHWVRSHQKNYKVLAQYPPELVKDGKWTGEVRFLEQNIYKPLTRKKPTVYAVWNDLFALTDEQISRAMIVMGECPQHTFVILTKRVVTMHRFFKRITLRWPENAIIGVSVENQSSASIRIPVLYNLPRMRKIINIGPMLGPVDLRKGVYYWLDSTYYGTTLQNVDGVILEGESGPHARPMHPDWVRSVRDQCQAAGVPFFFKQWGEWYPDRRGIYENARTQIFGNTVVHRIGRKAAGRTLDGHTHDELCWEVK
jgi:protein gp37